MSTMSPQPPLNMLRTYEGWTRLGRFVEHPRITSKLLTCILFLSLGGRLVVIMMFFSTHFWLSIFWAQGRIVLLCLAPLK